MDHRIITANKLQRLLGAAANLQGLMDDGTLAAAFEARDPDCTNDAVTAFDALTTARVVVAGEIKTASPFLRYRREILAESTTGALLRRLVLSMYGTATTLNLRAVAERLDDTTARIALELLTAYLANGDRDSQFMSLAIEIAESITHEPVEAAA